MSCDGWVALPPGAMGLSAVCDYGICWSYSLFFIDTLVGKGKELVRFWWPWPYFQGHRGTLKFPNMVSVHYLLNKWMDFNQTGKDTLLGKGKELIRFWWPWPYFQAHTRTSGLGDRVFLYLLWSTICSTEQNR